MKTIIGGTISSLVLAERLSYHKLPVRLIIPSKPRYNDFKGISLNGQIYDIGPHSLELEFESNPRFSPFPLYRNFENYSHFEFGPFIRNIKKYLENLVNEELIKLPTPQMYFRDQFNDCIYLSSKTSSLSSLDPHEKEKIKNEILNNDRKLLRFNKNNFKSPMINYSQTGEIFDTNHGETFNKIFIQPFAEKVCSHHWRSIPFAYRRKIWLTSFFPETLLSSLKNVHYSYSQRSYFRFSKGKVGTIVDELKKRLRKDSFATIIDGDLQSIIPYLGNNLRLSFKDGCH